MNKLLVIAFFLSGCFMGNPVDYFDKMADCIEKHPKHQDICLEIDKRTKGYPFEIDFETEYQKLLKEQENSSNP